MAFDNCIIDPACLPLRDKEGNIIVDRPTDKKRNNMTREKFLELEFLSRALHFETKDIKALFSYHKIDMIEPNQTRLISDIKCAMENLKEMKEILVDCELWID